VEIIDRYVYEVALNLPADSDMLREFGDPEEIALRSGARTRSSSIARP
jgi:hypothetical protein